MNDLSETNRTLRVLMLEDTATDAELEEYELRKAGISFTALRVETKETFIRALEEFQPDIILSDYSLPEFNGMSALKIVQGSHPEIPVIMITGALNDIEAVELIHAGAKDYVLKDRLARLGQAVQRALSMEREARARKVAEEKIRKISEAAQDAVIMMADKRVQFWNAAAERIFGYSAAEAMDRELHQLVAHPHEQDAIARGLRRFNETGEGPFIGKILELTALHKNGNEIPVELSISAAQLNGVWHAIGIARDISERKVAEAAVIHANRALATLSEVNRSLVYVNDENELLQAICQAIVEHRGYRMAWVGYVSTDPDRPITIKAHAGHDEDFLSSRDTAYKECMHTINTGKTKLIQDLANDGYYLQLRDKIIENGYKSAITLPLINNETVFGILNVYAEEVNAFTPDEVTLLEEMAGDLAFGVKSLHIRIERDLALELNRKQLRKLEENLEDTIRAMATIVEIRDPYTAGHQTDVSTLAVNIASRLGLSENRIHAIHLASLIHDLGKIKIPAEFLSKSGKITDIEFEIIKGHSQAGYDILKDIDFPWPIAQMVLQHHEKLDGSGYPQGLKDGQILLEARILTVADIVEAMSSHRPYRPALSMELALAEIEAGKGVRFDPEVVDACVSIIHENGMKLPRR